MRLTYGGHDSHLGLGDLREDANLAGLVGPHLDDHDFGVRGRRQQGEGHADLVVEVADGGVDPQLPGQGSPGQVLGRRLPRGPGDAHDAGRKRAAAVSSQTAQGLQGARHLVQPSVAGVDGPRNHCPEGTPCQGLSDVIVTVETVPYQSHEQVALGDAAAVGADPPIRDGVIGIGRREVQGGPHLLVGPDEARHRATPPAR